MKTLFTIALVFCFIMPCFADDMTILKKINNDIFIETITKIPKLGHFGTDGEELFVYIDGWKNTSFKIIKTELSVYKLNLTK